MNAGPRIAEATAVDSRATALLEVRDLEKRYGGVHALDGAEIQIFGGEIHGLIGENGSGKSTLLGIISGQRRPDGGQIVLDGEEIRFRDPSAALARGIVTVTQEMTLVPDLSVAENIFLGRRMARSRLGIDWSLTRRNAVAILERIGAQIDPDTPVRDLRPNEQQQVEIARAISGEARLLILDEPTSSMTDDEVEALFAMVRRLRDSEVTTVFVSHRLNEVFELVDRVTVLRDGRTVGSGPIADYDRARMIEEMVGHRPEDYVAADVAVSHRSPVFRAISISLGRWVHDVSFEVGVGEIVGLAGLVGAGRSELLESLFGLHADAEGGVEIASDQYPLPINPRQAMQRGIGYVPADRKNLGLIPQMTVGENLLMAAGAMGPRLRVPSRAGERELVDDALKRFQIKAESPNTEVTSLSGGNQQKVVLSKWLENRPQILLLDEPTRGVDVGSKEEIYRLLEKTRDEDIAIVVSSSETDELLLLCDRILVMFRGQLVASLSRRDADEARIAHYATGHFATGNVDGS